MASRASAFETTPAAAALFDQLARLCRGRPRDLAEDIFQVRSWLTDRKDKRPSGYMNHPRYFSAYAAYHLPLHLPELYWILEQNQTRLNLLGQPPQSVMDLGCGPGTLSLAYLLWAQTKGLPLAKSVRLADFSKQAVSGAKTLVTKLVETLQKSNAAPAAPTETIAERLDLNDRFALSARHRADWVFLGHVLNEWGSGPRVRERKLEFILKLLESHVNPGGLLFIVEPPLREPTLDLMWLRDRLADPTEFDFGPAETSEAELDDSHEEADEAEAEEPATPLVVAPCPAGTRFCPMIRNHMGWCYAQPPREWAESQGIAPWDNEIRRTLGIRLEDPGFSYIVLRAPGEPGTQDHLPPHSIGITDGEASRQMACTKRGARVQRVPFRGAYITPGTLSAGLPPPIAPAPDPQKQASKGGGIRPVAKPSRSEGIRPAGKAPSPKKRRR